MTHNSDYGRSTVGTHQPPALNVSDAARDLPKYTLAFCNKIEHRFSFRCDDGAPRTICYGRVYKRPTSAKSLNSFATSVFMSCSTVVSSGGCDNFCQGKPTFAFDQYLNGHYTFHWQVLLNIGCLVPTQTPLLSHIIDVSRQCQGSLSEIIENVKVLTAKGVCYSFIGEVDTCQHHHAKEKKISRYMVHPRAPED